VDQHNAVGMKVLLLFTFTERLCDLL